MIPYHSMIVILEHTYNTEISGTSSKIKEAIIVLWWETEINVQNMLLKCNSTAKLLSPIIGIASIII